MPKNLYLIIRMTNKSLPTNANMQTLTKPSPLLLLLILFVANAKAQEITLSFYDSSWKTTSKEAAFYVTQNTKVEDLYLKKTYYVESQKLHSVSSGPDLLLRGRKIGLAIGYFKNGMTKDSTFYNKEGQPDYTYAFYDNGQLSDAIFYGSKFFIDSARHYYESGKLKAYYINDKKSNFKLTKGFDEDGKEIKDYIYSAEADFKGGVKGFRNFLQKNLDANVPVKNGAPAGTYQVIARFVVNTDGSISGVAMETRHGYGMELEVLRILQISPPWQPAIKFNQVVKAYRRQPVTFVISEQKR